MTDPSILTIIVPAYNEEARIAESLDKIAAYITETTHPVDVIVVNNNSTDRTSEIVNTYAERYSFIQQLHQPVQGKGAALKMGIMAGRGKYLFLCDADLSMPIEEVEKFIPPALGDYDIAIASREIPGSNRVGEPEYRHLMGRVYNLVVRLFAIPNIQDTQCGFKSYRRDIAQEVFTLQTINGWGFDVEVLYIALHHGYKIISPDYLALHGKQPDQPD
jgi:dolichyl-phosphate beta-glucosyltransferase